MASEGNVGGASSAGIDSSEPSPAESDEMKRATYEDVLNAPENKVAEILDGQLFLSPRPALPHAGAQSAIHGILWSQFDNSRRDPSGWVIVTEPELHLGQAVVVPDVAGWRRQRLPEIPDGPWTDLSPDWVCEVLSPSTERIDRGRKLRIYAQAGVKHAWLVKPTDRTLEVLRLHEGAWKIVGIWEDVVVVRAEPFEAIELQLERLWPGSPPGSPTT